MLDFVLFSPSHSCYYTGRAGIFWVSENKKEAFSFTDEGARRKTEVFNTGAFYIRDWVVVPK
jgi:hypothetical protein